MYAENFNLRPRISFNTKILKVTRNHIANKDQWELTYTKLPAKYEPTDITETFTQVFDAVLVCTGHHWHPSIPQLPNIEAFRGKIIHSSSFKETKNFYGKNVLVVGKCEKLGDALRACMN